MPAKHPDEQVVDGLVEAFYADLKMLYDFYMEAKAFHEDVSDEELYRRYQDPQLRAATESMIQYAIANKVQLPSALLQYYDQMARIVSRYGPTGPGGEVAGIGPGQAATETG